MSAAPAPPSVWRGVAVGLALAGAAVGLLVLRTLTAAPPADSLLSASARRAGQPLPVLWRVPPFDLPAQDGRRLTPAALRGKVWVADFIFTQCNSACPRLTAKLSLLQRQLPEAGIAFVSVSVDPLNDTPEVLRDYARHWAPEPRWWLLATTPRSLAAFAEGLRVAAEPSGDPQNPVLHSSLFFLVDQDGAVRGVYDAEDNEGWRRLPDDARELLHAPAAPLAPGGPVSLRSLGCAGCHDRPQVAPPLAGLFGHPVLLTTGQTVVADAAYLRESIADPGARLVAGYAPIMPSYKTDLTSAQLDALVAELEALPAAGAAPGPAAAGAPAEDPICHMQVATVDSALRVQAGGQTHHFCSRRCLEEFQRREQAKPPQQR